MKTSAASFFYISCLVLLLLVVLPVEAFANDPGKKFWDTTKYYYEEKNLIVATKLFVKVKDRFQLLGKDASRHENKFDLLLTFFANALMEQPEKAMSVAKHVIKKGNDVHHFIIADSVSSTNLKNKNEIVEILHKSFIDYVGEDAKGEADKLFKNLQAKRPFNFKRLELNGPHDLDVAWVAFFATGDNFYTQLILEQLQYWMPKEELITRLKELDEKTKSGKEESVNLLNGYSAEWSLYENAKDHVGVVNTLIKAADGRSDKVGQTAKKILIRLATEK
ncbi:MAG: hypothetical protein OQJ97_09530 [Rhodospirillales bacterium]|nr:hypothetical protein [Rhodospirillales bacterium]